LKEFKPQKNDRFGLGDLDFSVFFSCVNLTNFAKLKNNRQNFDMKKKKKPLLALVLA
jgi:hypothetical protein